MKADLHVHSTASDGKLSPSELVELSVKAGLTHIALTDHDTVEGIDEALRAACGTDLMVIPAVELSTITRRGQDAHILGLFVDPSDPDLLARLSELRAARLERAREMVRLLRDDGYAVSFDSVMEIARGGAVGRSHVARALVDAGAAPSIAHAFQELIGQDRPYYVHKASCSPQQAIELIHSARGLAFVAHPGVLGLDELVRELADNGLDGVEAYHADHTHLQRLHYAELASDLGLLVSGGSDFHAHDARNPPLGSVDVPECALRALLAAVEAR